MKAIEVMLWLLLFNASIALVGGLEIFNIPAGPLFDYAKISASGEPTVGRMFDIMGIWAVLIAGAIAGAFAGVLTFRIKLSDSAVYSTILTLVTGLYANTILILTQIITSIEHLEARSAVTAIVVIFLAINALMFIMGVIQLVRGGMQSAM